MLSGPELSFLYFFLTMGIVMGFGETMWAILSTESCSNRKFRLQIYCEGESMRIYSMIRYGVWGKKSNQTEFNLGFEELEEEWPVNWDGENWGKPGRLEVYSGFYSYMLSFRYLAVSTFGNSQVSNLLYEPRVHGSGLFWINKFASLYMVAITLKQKMFQYFSVCSSTKPSYLISESHI